MGSAVTNSDKNNNIANFLFNILTSCLMTKMSKFGFDLESTPIAPKVIYHMVHFHVNRSGEYFKEPVFLRFIARNLKTFTRKGIIRLKKILDIP